MLDSVLQALFTDATRAISTAGGTPYLVGGAVRDALLRRPSKDLDLLVTGLEHSQLGIALEQVGDVDLVGKSFGVLKLSRDGVTLDVALPRLERSTGSGHRDFEVSYDPDLPLERDLERRDLTINAIAWRVGPGALHSRPAAADLVDPFGGLGDLERGVLRAVGNPSARFEEDPLRMLRLARFAAKLDFTVDAVTAEAVKLSAHLIETVAPERTQSELLGLLSAQEAQGVLRALRFLRDSGLLEYVLPEFAPTIGFDQRNPHHHLTLDEHAFEAVRYAVARGSGTLSRVALLLHDLGKPATQTFSGGVAHYYGHECVGAEIAAEVLTRLKFPRDAVIRVTRLVREHMKPPLGASDKVLRKFVNHLGADWPLALEVREADRAAHAPEGASSAEDSAALCAALFTRCAAFGGALEGFDERALAVTGGELTEEFGVRGAEIGALKKAATRAVIDGEIPNEHTAVFEWLRAHRGRGGRVALEGCVSAKVHHD